MANVRSFNGTSDSLGLGAGGGSLAGYGGMILLRPLTLATTNAWMAAVDLPSASLGVLYYEGNASVHEVSLGSPGFDLFTQSFTLNTTDLWLIGWTKPAGTTAVTFHAANITTGAAAQHFVSGATAADTVGTWDRTEIGSGDGAGFFGNINAGCAALFTSVYSNADFDAVAAAKSTQSIFNLTPARMWDINQASVATAPVNLMTGSADQLSIAGTTVVSDAAFNAWTFGLTGGAANFTASLAGAGSISAVPHAGVTEVATGAAAAATSGDVTVSYPSSAGQVLTDDVILCDVTARDNVTLTFPGGWTKKFEANNGTGLRKTLAWKRRAGGDSDTNVAVTHTGGAQIIARVHVIRGAVASGDPFEATGGPTSVSPASTGTFPSVTTLSAGSLLFYSFGYQDDFATAPAITNAQGLTLTERDSTEVP